VQSRIEAGNLIWGFETTSNQPFQNLWLVLSNMINPVIVLIVILWLFIKNNDLYYHPESPTTRRASGLDFSAIGGKKTVDRTQK